MIESVTGGREGKRRTAVAMLFNGDATQAYVKLQGRAAQMVSLKQLGEEELKSVAPTPLSYFAHGYAGRVCIQLLVAYDDAGSVVARTGRRPCF
jgi:hypothetical protein